MCSFLLVFLLVIIAFDILHDSAVEWNIAPTPAQTAGCRSQSLVLALQRAHHSTLRSFDKDSSYVGQTSLKGLESDQTHPPASRQDGGAVALALQPVPSNKQEDCHPLRHLSWSLDQWGTTQYTAQADLAKERGQCLGRMVPVMGRPSTELGMESAFKISLKSKYAQLSKLTQCKAHCPDQTQQGEGEEKIQEPQRREKQRHRWRCDCKFALCAPCHRNATLAHHGFGCEPTDAAGALSFLPTSYRCCCPEKRSCTSPTCRLSRQCQHAGGHQGADRQDGEGHREIGERELQGHYQKSPFSHESLRKGPEDAHRGAGSQKRSQAQMDQTHCQCSQNVGESTPRISTATSHLPRSGYEGQVRHRTCTECHPVVVNQSHIGHPSIDAADHTNQCRNRRYCDRCRSGGRKCPTAATVYSPELCGFNRSGSHNSWPDRDQFGDGRRQPRSGHKEKNEVIRTFRRWGWLGIFAISCTETVIAGGAGLVHSNSLHDASQQAESADAYVMSQWPMSRAACTAQLTNFDYDRFCRGSTRSKPTRNIRIPLKQCMKHGF